MSNHSESCVKNHPKCECNTCVKDRTICQGLECRSCPAMDCEFYEKERSKHTKSCMETQPNCQCNTCVNDNKECCIDKIGCHLTNCINYENEEESECQCYTCKKSGFPYCVNLKRGCKCENYENEEEK